LVPGPAGVDDRHVPEGVDRGRVELNQVPFPCFLGQPAQHAGRGVGLRRV